MSKAKTATSETRVWLTSGTLVRNYVIDARVAACGLGEVYSARERGTKRLVALKVLPAPSGYSLERLEVLAQQMSRQVMPSHPGLAEIYEIAVTENGKLIIASEYVCGQSLDTLMNAKASLDVENIAEQIAEALQALHAEGFVHGDLKMSNVMLTVGGKIKLLDYGFPQFRSLWQASEEEARASEVRHYSPEHINGRALTAQSDLFSFGSLLYELTTGVAPFAGETPLKVCAAIVWSKPQQLTDWLETVSEDWAASILKLLQKDASQRTVSAAVFLNELKQQRLKATPPPKHLGAAAYQAGREFLGTEDGRLVTAFGRGTFQLVFSNGASWAVMGLSMLVACYALVSFLNIVGVK